MGELAASLGTPVNFLFEKTDLFYAIPLVGTPLYDYARKLKLLGNTLDDEEKYLELVSNIGAYKRYYINLNGSKMSEVVFWDNLVFLEATKTFVKLMKGKKYNYSMIEKLCYTIKEIQSKNPNVSSKENDNSMANLQIFGGGGGDDKIFNKSFISKNFITNFLKKHVVFNLWIAKYIPRFILYPIVRYLLYFEYLFQNLVLKDTNNIHKISNALVNSKNKISFEDVDPSKFTQIERSLRAVIKRRFPNIQNLENGADKLAAGP